MDLENIVEGFAITDLARVCKEAGLSVQGFSKKMELAPRPLLVGALTRGFAQGGPKREKVLLGLGRLWGEQNPELMAELRREVGSLRGSSEVAFTAWLVRLGQRLGRRKASQAVALALGMMEGATPYLADVNLLRRAMDQWPPEEAAPPVEAERGEIPSAEPAPARVAESANQRKENRNAAQVKELQQTVKRLKGEVQALERKLRAAQSREVALVESLSQARASLMAHQTAAELPEPRERTHRLVKALFELLREQELLQGEVQRLRGEVAAAAE